MSDAIRSYSRPSSYAKNRSRGLLRQGLRFTRFILLFVVIGCVYLFWISRNTHDIRNFVPNDAAYQITSKDLVQNRDRILESRVWQSLPDTLNVNPIVGLLDTDIATSDMVLRNVMGQHLLIYGQDAEHFSDAVFIVKMTAVGTLLERKARRQSTNMYDEAGGLGIRFLSEHELYYSTRGRLIISSLSREALVRALTLPADAVVGEALDINSLWPEGDEDIRGRIHFTGAKDDRYFSAVGFAARLELSQGFLKMTLPCAEAFYQDFNPSELGNAQSKLIQPVDGPLSISKNLPISMRALCERIEVLNEFTDIFSPGWAEPSETELSPLEAILEGTTNSMAYTWHGYAVEDIIPVPVYSIITADQGDLFQRLLNDASENTDTLHFDEASNTLAVNLVGGETNTALMSASSSNTHLLYSSSIHQSNSNWGEQSEVQWVEAGGHIYVHLAPAQLLEEYATFGESMIAYGMLADHTLESFVASLEEWKVQVASIDELVVRAEHSMQDKEFHIDVRVQSSE